jgi:hypothetical protein
MKRIICIALLLLPLLALSLLPFIGRMERADPDRLPL